LYARFLQTADRGQDLLLLAVRVYWGWQFAQTGWGKFENIHQVAEFFASLGIPSPAANAWFVAVLELVGGVLIFVGLASRPTAFLLTANMSVAFYAADREALMSIISDPEKFYGAAPYTFLFASLLVLFFGPGKFALDVLFRRKGTKENRQEKTFARAARV
jgi:putative oxidoreductase